MFIRNAFAALAAASILFAAMLANAAPVATRDASGETVCPVGAAVAKSTTIDPTTGAIRVRTICVLFARGGK